ncbi:alanine dehydrogenase [Syntrophus gentianae]|uniref:Alanine dehydrogenase n=1 Tax=Syntrophus gentianae TaxID=43775 RepID=A0A1H7WYY5_9BACT|nr:alanine dehydrogenase [Syntrophus gentianae]SEM26743.1 alanine dehydrogenase [Syntrophus gentianae]
MKIGVPKEIKDNEYRVALTPGSVEMLVREGAEVLVQCGAGEGSGFADQEYRSSGAILLPEAAAVWEGSAMIMKVKEPQPVEYAYLRKDMILFTYLHLAAEPELTKVLLEAGTTAIAYETVQLDSGVLPLLMPMSEVAGRMSIQVIAHYLEKENGGRGKLLGGVPGVRPADVVILGGGIVGSNAAKMALGMGAHVTIIDTNADRLRYLDEVLHGNLTTLGSNFQNIADSVKHADGVVGSVLIPGAKAPKLVSREMVASMKPGSVIVDVAIDQGGCVETARPTKHSDPVYRLHEVIHYCVTNMPGAVPRTSTYALNNVTLPYAMKIAKSDLLEVIKRDTSLFRGVNTLTGHLTSRPVGEAHSLEYVPLQKLFKS